MPTLTLPELQHGNLPRTEGEHFAACGQRAARPDVPLTARTRLFIFGPVLDVVVSVPKAQRDELRASGRPAPASLQVHALIDTGATVSGFTRDVIRRLGLQQSGVRPVVTQLEHELRGEYCGFVEFPRTELPAIEIPKGVAISDVPRWSPGGVLLGRDWLGDKLLTYDGRAGSWRLEW